jgi:poly-gamma-glutamate system protein
MKKLYWRPERISRKVLVIVALFAIAGVLSVETFRVEKRQRYFKEKLRAARVTQNAFREVKEERLRRRIRIDREADPAASGLVGILLSPTTTNPGHLPAKQTSINPNFSAVVVHLLKQVDVEKDGVVAVGLSGSFPAINLAVLAAIEAIGARAIVITSIGASQWGANIPKMLWPDIEEIVFNKKILHTRSIAYSLGGINDRGLGLSDSGIGSLEKAILKSGIQYLEVASYEESVERRFALYRQAAEDRDIAAYINVGGGTSSVGTRVGKKLFKPGLNRTPPQGVNVFDSVMSRFSVDGVPVIHMSSIDDIAARYGLPLQPTTTPKPGQGKVFRREVYNTWLATIILTLLVFLLWVFGRMDIGYRFFHRGSTQKSAQGPQQMV